MPAQNGTRPLVAVAQYEPSLGDVTGNLAASIAQIRIAAEHSAAVVVLPECCLTGYEFEDRAALALLAESVTGVATQSWANAAATHNMYIVAGMVEKHDGILYDSAVIVSPRGEIHTYRKWHLWGLERALYQSGDALVHCDTPWGRLGVMICYDLWFPEMARALALAGCTLLAVPSNWAVNARLKNPFDEHGLPLGYHMAVAAACSNEMVVAVSDRIGRDRTLSFLGNSCVIGPAGRPLTHRAAADTSEMLLAEWPDVEAIRAVGQSHLASRRSDLYGNPRMSTQYPVGREHEK